MGKSLLAFFSVLVIAFWWQSSSKSGKLKYWLFVDDNWNKNDNLRTMKRVLKRSGHTTIDGFSDDSWDILWSIEYPMTYIPEHLKNLKPHQKVNHFPNLNYITDKSWMSTKNNFQFIPKSFKFPEMKEAFKKFFNENPKSKFVVKENDNRGVKVVSHDEINFESTDGKFYQEYIENPLLIDGRAFDLGIYVLITSIDPLRIYKMNTEILLRFCPEPYYPFDPKNVDKYVIQESQQTIFEMPSLKSFVTKLGFSFKKAFETHLQSRGFHPVELWNQINYAILNLTAANQENFIKGTKKFAASKHYFELVRFDFIIDNDLVVHLMEVNMSPNLTPADAKFEGHAPSYENVFYNTLQCAIGIDSNHDLR